MIVTMKKAMILGASQYRETLLRKLQGIGVVHIEPVVISKSKHASLEEQLDKTAKAIEILERHRQEDSKGQDVPAADLVTRVLELDSRLRELRDQESEYRQKYEEISKWGDFSWQNLAELEKSGVCFRFWRCPGKDVDKFQATQVSSCWEEGNETGVVTVSYAKELTAPPSAKEIFINSGTRELSEKIKQTQKEAEKTQADLQGIYGNLSLLKKHSCELNDEQNLQKAADSSLIHQDVFGLVGWVPVDLVDKLKNEVKDDPIAMELKNPDPGEEPPTLIKNPRWIQSILDIVKLYATPGYNEWDTSVSVYFAFTVFFGMIVGDAGYGFLLLLMMLKFRKKLMQSDVGARVYRLMVTLSASVIVFGALSGTWFAIALGEGNFLRSMQLTYLDSTYDVAGYYGRLMWLSVFVGAIHLTVARIVQSARVWNSTLWLAELGWIIMIWSGISYVKWNISSAMYSLEAGALMVLLFSSTSWNPFKRIAGGLLGLLGVSQNLADVLSYLRLFALGLATMVMGSIFNDLGMKVHDGITVPVLGTVLMILIIFMGHTINLVLAIMGGFIHGLRLNFLEFYRYCFEGTGYDYRPLLKTDV